MVKIQRVPPEAAEHVVAENIYERKVRFTVTRTQVSHQDFERSALEAMREYIAAKESRVDDWAPFGKNVKAPDPDPDFTASNGVRIQVEMLTHDRGALAEKTDPIVAQMSEDDVATYIVFPSQGFTEEDYKLAEAEMNEIAKAKPNPRKTA